MHTLLVLQAMVKKSSDPMCRFAALVHDSGKGKTPIEEWPSHHRHEERGVLIIEALCQRLRIPVEWRKFAMLISRFHLTIHRISQLRAETIVKVLEQTDAFRRPEQFDKLVMVCAADANGRIYEVDYEQVSQWRFVLDECLKIKAQRLLEQGYQGIAIKHELHIRRIACVELILNSWKQHDK